MQTLKAVHEIIRGAAGGREIIAPGKGFTATAEEAKYLLKLGAAVEAAPGEVKVEAPSVIESKPAGGEPAGKALGDMTVAELLAYAKDHNIEVDASGKKAEILAEIEAAETDEDEII